MQWHVGEGAGGTQHFMEHLRHPMAGMLKVLDKPQITPELKRTIADGMMQEAGNCSVEQIAKEEDELLVGLLRLRRKAAKG